MQVFRRLEWKAAHVFHSKSDFSAGVYVMYVHNFVPFLPIFGEKMAFFLKNVMIHFLEKN
jgi:hypothetical protein